MDNYSGLKRVTSNPGPAKVMLNNPNAKPTNAIANGGDGIAYNKIGSAPSLQSKINSDQLPAVPSRNKTTDNLMTPAAKKGPNRHTVELDSKKQIVSNNNRPLSTGPTSSAINSHLPPVAPRKGASASPTTSEANSRDTKANNGLQVSVPPVAPRKVGAAVESTPPKVQAAVPPPTAPRNIDRPNSPSPSPSLPKTNIIKPEAVSAVPPPTAPRVPGGPMSPTLTRNVTNKPETAVPPKVDSKPKLMVPTMTSPRNSNNGDTSPKLSPREGNVPPLAPRVPTTIAAKVDELPPVPSRTPTNTSNNTTVSGAMSPPIGRNNPAAAAKKASNPSTPSTSGEFIIPKTNSGPTIPRVNTPPPVVPRTGDAPNTMVAVDQSNKTTILPPVAPRKVGDRVNSNEGTDQPTKVGSNPSLVPPTAAAKKRDSNESKAEPTAARGHGVLASSMPTRNVPHTELRTSTPVSTQSAFAKITPNAATVVQANPVQPVPALPKARTDPLEIVPGDPVNQISETTGSPRPKSAPFKIPVIQAKAQRKTADDALSPRSALSPRLTPRSHPKSPVSPSPLSPTPIERPVSPSPNVQAVSDVPAIVIEEDKRPQPVTSKHSKPQPSVQGTTTSYSKPGRPLSMPEDEDEPVHSASQGAGRYTKITRPPTPPEDEDEPVQPASQGVARYTKNVPLSPRSDDEDSSNLLAPPASDDKRSSVDVDIDPILMTLSPKTLQYIQEADEGFFYGNGLDYYLDPANQVEFEALKDEPLEVKEAHKAAWVKVTKPKSRTPRGDISAPDLAKTRGTIDPDEFPTRRVSVAMTNRNINYNEPPEEDSGNENAGPPGDVPAAPKDDESEGSDENKAAAKAKKDLKKIQKFFTKVIPKKLGINKDKDDKEGDSSSDSSSDSEGKAGRTKTVAFDDSTLTPEEREQRRKQLEEEERVRKEEKERRKQEKERLKREQKEREEKEKEERDKIKQAEKEEKDRIKREEKEKEDKEKEERDKIKQAEKEKEKEEKERLRKDKEEREAKEKEERDKEAASKPAGIANFKVDKKAPNITKILPKLSEDDGERLNHVTVDRPAFKGRRPPTRVLRAGIVNTEGDNEINGQEAPTPATPMEL